MAKNKPKPKDEKPQKERFIEAAREVGTDESGRAFERAFKKIMRSKIFWRQGKPHQPS